MKTYMIRFIAGGIAFAAVAGGACLNSPDKNPARDNTVGKKTNFPDPTKADPGRVEPAGAANKGERAKHAHITFRVLGLGGTPLAGMRIRSLSGKLKGVTDGAGLYSFRRVPRGRYVFRVSGPGRTETFRAVHIRAPGETFLRVKTAAVKTIALKNMDRNVEIRRDDMILRIPANTFLDKDGRPVRNAVLEYRYLNVRGPDIHAMPGEFKGVNIDGRITDMESFGAVSIRVLRDFNGPKLKMREGARLGLELPFQGSAKHSSVPLWSFDVKRGLWIRESDVRVARRGGRLWARGELPHLSWWNVDAPLKEKSSIWVQSFMDEKERNLFTPYMTGRGLSYNGVSHPHTTYDRRGTFLPGRCVDVKRGSRVRLQADFFDGRDIYEVKRDFRARDVPASCGVQPRDGIVIPRLRMRRVALTCVQGRVSIKGVAPGFLRTELRVHLKGLGEKIMHRGRVKADGSFRMDRVPAGREAWIYFIGPMAKSLEECDRESYAPFRVKLPPGAASGKACVNLGELKGIMNRGRCVPGRGVPGNGDRPGPAGVGDRRI